MRKEGSLVYGTLLLTGANLLLRLISVGFQVYLSGQLGAVGTGLVQLTLSVAALSFTLGAAGSRTCATYLTAEALGRGRSGGAVLEGCCRYSLGWSLTAGVCLWLLSPWLAEIWIGDAAVSAALRLYAVFLPVRCLNGVLTGYFTAAGRLSTHVAVQFAEQGCCMAVVFLLLSRWPDRAALAVAAGNCAAAALSFCALTALAPREEKAGPLPCRRIWETAMPVAAADGLRGTLNTGEHLIIPRRLALYAGTANALADYGVLHGMVFPLMMFPAAVLFSLAELLVPELSRCAAGGRWPRVRYLARRGIRTALGFGICVGAVLFLGAGILGERLYGEAAAGTYLRLYAPFVPVIYLDSVVDGMCKGLGQQGANARYNALTSFLDVVFLWALLPRWGMGGYYFSYAVTHLVNFALSLRRLYLSAGLGGRPPAAAKNTRFRPGSSA